MDTDVSTFRHKLNNGMDLGTALQLRELGYSQQTDLKMILEERAEDAFIDSSAKQHSVKLSSTGTTTKATYLIVTSVDGRYVASSHGDHNIYVTCIASGKVVQCLSGHSRTAWSLAFHPTRTRLLASGCLAGYVKVWDLKTGCCESVQVEGGESAVASLAFHPVRRLLLIAVAHRILFWDWQSSTPYASIDANRRERVRYVKFDTSGHRLFTAVTNVQRQSTAEVAQSTSEFRRPVVPPSIIPSRCQELLRARRDLLSMRSELSERHQLLLQRYNDLVVRYEELRDSFPDNETPPTEQTGEVVANTNEQQPASGGSSSVVHRLSGLDANHRQMQRSLRELEGVRLFAPPGAASGGNPRFANRVSNRDDEESAESTEGNPTSEVAEGNNRTGGESPLRLERLDVDEMVQYAHQVTTTSMQQFIQLHTTSMESLHRSYVTLSRSACALVENFKQTYQDMMSLQEQIDRRWGLTGNQSSSFDPAKALLNAMTRMQRVLVNRCLSENLPTDDTEEGVTISSMSTVNRGIERQRQTIGQEVTMLIEVYNALLEGMRAQLPPQIRHELERNRLRVIGLRSRLRDATDRQEMIQMQTEAKTESTALITAVGNWKEKVVRLWRSTNVASTTSTDEADIPSSSNSSASTSQSTSTLRAKLNLTRKRSHSSLDEGETSSASIPPRKYHKQTKPASAAATSNAAEPQMTDVAVQHPSPVRRRVSHREGGDVEPVQTDGVTADDADDDSGTVTPRTRSTRDAFNNLRTVAEATEHVRGIRSQLSTYRAPPPTSTGAFFTATVRGASAAAVSSSIIGGGGYPLRRSYARLNLQVNATNSNERTDPSSTYVRSDDWRLRVFPDFGNAPFVSRSEHVRNLPPFHRRAHRVPFAPVGTRSTTFAQQRLQQQESDDDPPVYELHRAINRTIAGAFIGTGDVALANNILDFTCRIQEWSFTDEVPLAAQLPLENADKNVLVRKCKFHNDGSIALSNDGELLACFAENRQDGHLWADTVLEVVSLRPYDKGTVLYRKTFGPDAIAVSISPADTHILVGLACRRHVQNSARHLSTTSPNAIAQVFKMTNMDAETIEQRQLMPVMQLLREPTTVPTARDEPEAFARFFALRNSSLNCIRWLPTAGQGLVYGTNKGQLCFVTQDQSADRPKTPDLLADRDTFGLLNDLNDLNDNLSTIRRF